jgi:hypothetical protein
MVYALLWFSKQAIINNCQNKKQFYEELIEKHWNPNEIKNPKWDKTQVLVFIYIQIRF